MQEFVCPSCGHQSSYDPWRGSAHCPRCGYTPGPSGPILRQNSGWQRAAHQPLLDELLAYWQGRHAPQPQIEMPPADLAVMLFREYQRALGEEPVLRAGARMTYVRSYAPKPEEAIPFMHARWLLRCGEYDVAAQLLSDLTVRAPKFVDAWIWRSATTSDQRQREEWVEQAMILEPAHPLAQDAWAILKGRVRLEDPQSPAPPRVETTLADCPTCGAPLHHEAGATVECEYCGHEVTLPKADLLREKAPLVSDLRLRRRYEGRVWSEVRRAVRCESCGASLIMSHHVARNCPYCGSSTVIINDNQRSLQQPDGFVPFEITSERASQAVAETLRSGLGRLRQWLRGTNWRVHSVEGLYIPFWVFDGFVQVRAWVEPVTASLLTERKDLGEDTLMFSDLMFPAVKRPPKSLLEHVFPFALEQMVRYEPQLTADRPVALYTRDVEAVALQAHDRMMAMARQSTGRTATSGVAVAVSMASSSQAVTRVARSYQVSGASYQLVLLPLWLARVYSEDRYRVAVVNGQTGKVALSRALPGPPST